MIRRLLTAEIDALAEAAGRRLPHAPDGYVGRRIRATVKRYMASYFEGLSMQIVSPGIQRIIARAQTVLEAKAWSDSFEAGLRADVEREAGAIIAKRTPKLMEALFGPTLLSYYVARLRTPVAREAIALPPEVSIGDDNTQRWIMLQSRSPQEVARWAESHAGQRISGMNETSKRDAADIIARGLREGRDKNEIADALQDRFAQMSRDRAELIANMETSTALAIGAEDKARDDGATERAWVTMGSPETCVDGAPCYVNEDAGWIDYDSDFPNPGMPPLHFGCYCAVVYRGGAVPELADVQEDLITPELLDAALQAVVGYLSDVTYKSGLWLPGEELAAA